MADASSAEIRLTNGDVFLVEDNLDEAERKLSDAARSGSRLAWFTEHGTGTPLGVNPAKVAAIRQGESG